MSDFESSTEVSVVPLQMRGTASDRKWTSSDCRTAAVSALQPSPTSRRDDKFFAEDEFMQI